MKSTGVIINGVYYKNGEHLPQLDGRAATDKQYGYDKQRQEHAIDLIQPWANGKPNPEFIVHYPAEAKEYGFTKE